MPLGKREIGFGVILVVGGLAAAALHLNAQREYEAARQRYVENSHASAEIAAKGVEDALRSIYENVRTLTLLPSVQGIDRGSNGACSAAWNAVATRHSISASSGRNGRSRRAGSRRRKAGSSAPAWLRLYERKVTAAA